MAGDKFTAGDASVAEYHCVEVGDVVSGGWAEVGDEKQTILSWNHHDISATARWRPELVDTCRMHPVSGQKLTDGRYGLQAGIEQSGSS